MWQRFFQAPRSHAIIFPNVLGRREQLSRFMRDYKAVIMPLNNNVTGTLLPWTSSWTVYSPPLLVARPHRKLATFWNPMHLTHCTGFWVTGRKIGPLASHRNMSALIMLIGLAEWDWHLLVHWYDTLEIRSI